MRPWRSVLFCVIGFLIILITILSLLTLNLSTKPKIIFLDTKSDFSLDIDRSNKKTFEYELGSVSSENNNIFVVISPKVKQTPIAAGYGEHAMYYAEWNHVGIWNILTIYIDRVEYDKVDPEKSIKILKMFISREIVQRMNVLDNVSITDRL